MFGIFLHEKKKVTRDQNGEEKFEQIIVCNVGQYLLSLNNSTTTI